MHDVAPFIQSISCEIVYPYVSNRVTYDEEVGV